MIEFSKNLAPDSSGEATLFNNTHICTASFQKNFRKGVRGKYFSSFNEQRYEHYSFTQEQLEKAFSYEENQDF